MKVAIIGSGMIGRCWALLFSRAEFDVVVYDVKEEQMQAALSSIHAQLKGLHEAGLLPITVEKAFSHVSACSSLAEAVKGAVHVQECAPESVEVKAALFAQLDAVVDDECVVASSSSCIPPSKFTEGLVHRSQCLVAHPVNPPQYTPLVEIVPAPWTRPELTERTLQLMRRLGQAPIVLRKEVNGFVLNRLQYALLMEAWRLVEDGVCSAEDVDTAVSQGLGLRYSFMGPFETIDLNADGVVDYCERYGENITAVCREQSDPRALRGSPTAAVIEAAQRARVPREALAARRQWRDERLAGLAVHKQQARAFPAPGSQSAPQ